MPDNRTQNKLF